MSNSNQILPIVIRHSALSFVIIRQLGHNSHMRQTLTLLQENEENKSSYVIAMHLKILYLPSDNIQETNEEFLPNADVGRPVTPQFPPVLPFEHLKSKLNDNVLFSFHAQICYKQSAVIVCLPLATCSHTSQMSQIYKIDDCTE